MPHIHEKIDFTVEVFIVHKNKVLLRKHDKFKFWLSVGGHIELSEDPNQAAIREVKEEVGLDIQLLGVKDVKTHNVDEYGEYKELLAPRFLSRHGVGSNHEHVTLVYFATSLRDDFVQGQNEISDD